MALANCIRYFVFWLVGISEMQSRKLTIIKILLCLPSIREKKRNSSASESGAKKFAQEDRFLDRIAYVCQKMKVPCLHVG